MAENSDTEEDQTFKIESVQDVRDVLQRSKESLRKSRSVGGLPLLHVIGGMFHVLIVVRIHLNLKHFIFVF